MSQDGTLSPGGDGYGKSSAGAGTLYACLLYTSGHLVTVGAGGQHRTGQHRLVIQKDRAQAAVGSFAAAFDAQASMSAHKVDEPVSYTHLDVYKRQSVW